MTKDNMKVIALIPVKNEAWILPTCLSSLQGLVDETIVIDDNSTDNSIEVCKKYGATVIENDQLTNVSWKQHHVRQKLVDLGREHKGTHFVHIDADEALTSQFKTVGRKIMNRLEPGQKLEMQWLAMWKSVDHYRDDKSIWSNLFKDFVFCDNGKNNFEYQFIHLPRTPGENTDENLVRLNPKYGAMMHFQFSDWDNFQIKQCYKRCVELIKKPQNAAAINNTYSITLDDGNAFVKPVPQSWIKSLPLPQIDNQHDYSDNWMLQRMRDYFDEHGPEFFEPLQIWHYPLIRKAFVDKMGREPRSL